MHEDGWWDTGQVCLNGHIVNQQVVAERDHCQAFCGTCGKPTIAACRRCRASIRGVYHVSGSYVVETMPVLAYCLHCGRAYPWTDRRVQAAKELANELAQLKPPERELLKRSIEELLDDTPRTQLAVVRFKRLVAKAGPEAGIALREMLVNVVSEAVRRAIWGPYRP
jgi:hypothetical protein